MPEYRVRACNNASDSTNLIHHDLHARRLGFNAGLVPGVSVFAYLTRGLVELFGREWLARGGIDVRFVHPVYHGEEVHVSGLVRSTSSEGGVTLEVTAQNPGGVACALATASLLPRPEKPALSQYPPGEKPLGRPISLATLDAGEALTPLKTQFTWQAQWEYCQKGIHDHSPLYREVAHPAWLLGLANQILAANYHLPPWIHVSSDVVNLGLLTRPEILETRGRVRDRFERRGHHFAVLDVATFSEEGCLQTALHTVIFKIAPRAA